MNFLTRVKYLFGTLIVLGAVGALTVHLNDRISTVQGASATLRRAATRWAPATRGVVQQNAHVGDTVKAGEKLFAIKSNDLAHDIAIHAVKPKQSPFHIKHKDVLVVRAPSPGKIVQANFIKGAFVPTNASLARIQKQGTTHVRADFHLTPREYALMRQARTVTVTLPNQRQIRARITRITVKTSGQQAETQVRARARQLDNRGLFTTGTPVQVQVRLRKNGLGAPGEDRGRPGCSPRGAADDPPPQGPHRCRRRPGRRGRDRGDREHRPAVGRRPVRRRPVRRTGSRRRATVAPGRGPGSVAAPRPATGTRPPARCPRVRASPGRCGPRATCPRPRTAGTPGCSSVPLRSRSSRCRWPCRRLPTASRRTCPRCTPPAARSPDRSHRGSGSACRRTGSPPPAPTRSPSPRRTPRRARPSGG